MKLYLISENRKDDVNDIYPINLCYLAGYIRERAKIDIKILDRLSIESILEIIKKDEPDIIGITSTSYKWYEQNDLAKKIKEISGESLLIIGGSHITGKPDDYYKSNFDIAIVGDGEYELLNIINSKNVLKGIYYGKEIKEFNWLPARNLVDMKYYTKRKFIRGFRKYCVLFTSRGCLYNCSFCCAKRLGKIKFVPIDVVFEDIKELF